MLFQENECGQAYAKSTNPNALKSDILQIYRNGQSAQSLFQRLQKPEFSPEEITELLILCITHRKYHSFEYIAENLVEKESKWFGLELQRAILENPYSMIFMELLPAQSIHTLNKVDLLMMAISIPNVDVIDYILSDSQFINFGQVKGAQWEQIFNTIGNYGNQNVLEKLHKNCPIDLRRYGHIHILAAAEHGNFSLVDDVLESSVIFQHGMEHDLAIILVRKNEKALYLKLIKKFAIQQSNVILHSDYLLLTAIQHASFDLFEHVLARHREPLSSDATSLSLALAQAELHTDFDLFQQLKGLDLEGQYPLPLALAASLGFVDKLYALEHAASLRSEPAFDSLHLLEKFYPLYAFNFKYSRLSDPMQVSLFYDMKILSASFQSYIGAYEAACRGSLDCLTAFYEHDFCIPTNLEYNVMMEVIKAGHVQVFEFILERFSTMDYLCEMPEIQMAIIKSRNADLLRVLLETWPPVCLDIMQLAVDSLDPVVLQSILAISTGFTFNEHVVRKAFDSLCKSSPKSEATMKVLLHHFKQFAKIKSEQLIAAKDLDTLRMVLDCDCIGISRGLLIKAIMSRDLEIVKLVRSKMTSMRADRFYTAIYTCIKQSHAEMLSFILKEDCQLDNSQAKRILRLAASQPSYDILSLLSKDSRFRNVLDYHDLLCHAMKLGANDSVQSLLPLVQVNHRIFRNALRTNDHLRVVLKHPSLLQKKKSWWKKAAKTLGQVGNHEHLSIVMDATSSVRLKDVFRGAESHFRIITVKHLLASDRRLLRATSSGNAYWIGRFLYALRVFDLSLISEHLHELRSQDISAHDLVVPQLNHLFLDYRENIVKFAAAPLAVRQSRKAWHDYRQTQQ